MGFLAQIWKQSDSDIILSDWNIISTQLLNQWSKITPAELEDTQHSRYNIALLIQQKYGVHAVMAENYLKNLERRLAA